MRTKVDKKMAEAKLKMSMTSPKVVLDADDCAKLLDGMGKTSVIVVEKGGKMVAALPGTSPPAAISSTSSRSKFVSASQSKLCKSPISVCHASDSGASEGKSKSEGIAASASLNHNHTHKTSNGSEQTTKTIPKPPKKRRGNDKKFESSEPASALVSNGEAPPASLSAVRDRVGAVEGEVPAPDKLSLGSEAPHQHQVSEQPPYHHSSVSINNNNHLISGTHFIKPDDSSSFSLQSEKASLQPQASSSTSLMSSAQISSSSPSSSLSSPTDTGHTQAHPSYQSSLHNSTLKAPNVVYNKNCSDVNNSLGKVTDDDSQDQRHACDVESSLNPSTPAIKDGSFQQLPEQDEPMNLSTSCKSAISLVSSQSQASTSPKESRAVEEMDVPLLPQPSPTQGSTDLLGLGSDSAKPKPPAATITSSQGKKSRKKSPKGSRSTEKKRQGVQETSLSSIVGHENALVVSKPDPTVKCKEKSGSVSGRPEQGSGPSESRPTSSPSLSSKLPHSTDAPLPVQQETASESLSEPAVCAVQQTSLDSGAEPLSAGPSTTCPVTVTTDSHPDNASSATTPSSTTAEKCEDKDLLKVSNQVSTVATETLPTVDSKIVKAKKPPKKRVEIPMDEASCAERTAQYLETINDVIANFVYVPEPLEEECCLTEEEEAAIRDLFVEPPKPKKAAVNQKSSSKKSSSATKSDEGSGGTSTGGNHYAKAKAVASVSKPPKKRVTATVAEVVETGGSDQSTVSNAVDSNATDKGHVASAVEGSDLPSNAAQSKVSEEKVKSNSPPKRKKKSKKPVSKGSNESADSSLSTVQDQNVTGEKTVEDSPSVSSAESKVKTKKVQSKEQTVQSDSKGKITENVDSTSKESPPSVKPKKRKKTSGKAKGSKSAKMESEVLGDLKQACKDDVVLQDKDSVTSGRAETSDIGESIASTSGGSEQDTPVHEPETKDEMTNTEIDVGESQDTGVESGSEDNKPVRRYKKRLDFVKCTECDHQARGRSALSRHMKKAHMLEVNMPYKCSHCHYGCTKMASLNRHLFTHGVYPCSRCDFVGDERAKLLEHISELHKDKLDMKLCKVCNRYIKCDQITIEEHTDNCQGPTPFKCTQCEKEFKYASSLKVHYHTHFPDEPKRFKCELCEYRTNYKANLHKHHKNMHASKDRDVQCPDCGKMFSTEDNMRRHRKVHTLVRPFACETCKKTFKTSGALKGHQLIHTATRPYSCNIPGCSRSFRTPKFLKSHQEEFHRLVPKKFFCNVEGCNFSFFKRSHLKRHAITHTGERNYHCTWPGCSKSFRHADNLKVHFRSHTNEKPVQCHLCDFKCKQRNSLFWHKKKVHQIIDASAMPRRSDSGSKLGSSEAGSDSSNQVPDSMTSLDAAKDSPNAARVSSNAGGTTSQEAGVGTVSNTSEMGTIIPDKLSPGKLTGGGETPWKDKEELLNSKQASGDPSGQEPQGPKDLYEFKSDDESEEESPGNFRRDKASLTVLTPLPPPPKELLRKNELQEQKEKEKKEKEEKKEQEKKEKLEKKEQEKKEKAEKKEQEKKEKEELKEKEKKEKTEQKEKEKKEKEELKEKEKKEKEELKEKERKEKAEKKELEKKEKLELKEKEKQEKLDLIQKQKQEKADQKEKERKDRLERIEKAKQEREAKLLMQKTKKPKTEEKESKKEKTEAVKDGSDSNSGKKSPRRKKSPAGRRESIAAEQKPLKGKRKRGSDVSADKSKASEDSKSGASPPKKKKSGAAVVADPVSSPRLAAKKSPATTVKKVAVSKIKKKPPPKRKPSARIKAKKAMAKKPAKAVKKKAMKPVPKKKPGRKKVTTKVQEEKEEKVEKEEEKAEKEEENIEEKKEEEKAEVPEVSKEEEVTEPEAQPEPPAEVVPRPEEPVSSRPGSPEYREENMIQGVASPYRDFSDADNLEEENMPEEDLGEDQRRSPSPSPPAGSVEDTEALGEVKTQEVEEPMNDEGEEVGEGVIASAAEESDDDEVSNDIPLTPPRAPAPPPQESSEDEMEQEDLEPAPFSVPGPNTPFSVPGPNTPFSVPPPTNLVQQHSVHSEEAPMSVIPSVPSMENMHSAGSVDGQQPLGSVEMPHHGSVEMPHHGSVEMPHHGSVEIPHHGSVEMPHHGSVEMPHHGSVEMPHHGSVETSHPHGSVEMHSHSSVDIGSQGQVESRPHGSVEAQQPLGSVEMQHSHGSIPEPRSQPEPVLSAERTPEGAVRDGGGGLPDSSKYSLPQPLPEHSQQTTEAAKEYFDQYLKSLTHTRAASLAPSPGGLQQLEAMVDKSGPGSRELPKSPPVGLPTSVITSLESSPPTLPPADLRSRMDALVATERHHESFYPRDTASALPRLPERQTATPLAPNTAPPPPPAFDAFSSLNSLHSAAAPGSRESSYLRQPDNLFSTTPVTSSFMAEAMFQRQAMTTPFLTPQPAERSLSRIPDSTPLRSSTSSSLLRRTTTMPGTDMFPAPPMPQAMPRHPFTNAWASQEVRPTHWQNPYLPRQPNMATASNPFFPSKENYLGSREFMFDPSGRTTTERGMFPCLPSSQTQDSFQLDRFDLSNYFPNAMTPYAGSPGSLDYTRSAHPTAPKPFDERYRQTAAAAATAAIPDFRTLPPTTASTDMFSSIGVNSGFNLYAGTAYHGQHVSDNVNSAFLSHPTTAQHAMLERDYAAAAAHRSFYPHQNTPYPFIEDRQYPGASKLGHAHAAASTGTQERDLMSRSAVPESQMQDPYRSMLYRY